MKRIVIYGTVLFLIMACNRREDFDAMGTFEATEITISAEMTGRILNFPVEEGDTLIAQQSIGIIDTVQLYLQKLQLERQQASLAAGRPDISKQIASLQEQIIKQQTERRRIESLLKDHAATTKQLDDINAQLNVLNTQLEAQLSTLQNNTVSIDEHVSSIDLQIAQINDKLLKCHIISPISGTILAKYAEAGELATVGRPLLKIADMNRIYLRAYFTSSQLAEIQLGQPLTVTADFGGDKQFNYTGHVVWIASESEFTPKTIQTRDTRANLVYAVKIAVKNDGKLKLGMYGEVHLH